VIAPLRLNYTPHEQWSASGLAHDAACRRSYGLRYLEGRKEVALEWAEAEQLPEPPKAPKGASELEKKRAKEARKAWNKARRPALGKAGHAVIEAYFAQGVPGYWHAPMLWIDLAEAFASTPGQVVLPGLAYLPAPRECDSVLIEEALTLRWDFLPTELRAIVEADPLRFSGFKDLVPVVGGRVRLIDHKTTYDFAWCKTAAELIDDVQANLYAQDVMQRFGLDSIECTWVYYRTEGSPAAHPVSFTITRAAAEVFVTALVLQALELRAVMRSAPKGDDAKRHVYVMQLPANTEACDDFGGRDCHASRGGPCNAKPSYRALMRKQTTRRTTLAARREGRDLVMLTPEQLARKAELAAKADKSFKEKRELGDLEKREAEGSEATDTAEPAGAAPAASEPKADPAPAAAPTKPKAPKADVAPAASDLPLVTFNGVTFPIPAKSPLFKPIATAAKAFAAAEAALSGES
jgi:hypothetical protein